MAGVNEKKRRRSKHSALVQNQAKNFIRPLRKMDLTATQPRPFGHHPLFEKERGNSQYKGGHQIYRRGLFLGFTGRSPTA